MANFIDRLLDIAKRALDCANDSELANALDVGATRICNYRKGRALPNAAMARRIAHALDVPASWVTATIRRQKTLMASGAARETAKQVRQQSTRLREQARRMRETFNRPSRPSSREAVAPHTTRRSEAAGRQ